MCDFFNAPNILMAMSVYPWWYASV